VVIEVARVELAHVDAQCSGPRAIDLQIDSENLRPFAHGLPEREIAAADVEDAIRLPSDQVEQQPDLRGIPGKSSFD